MIRIKKLTLFAISAVLLSSCEVKYPIYVTAHPDHGKISLSADWSGCDAQITPPAVCNVKIADYSGTLSGEPTTLDHLFEPGACRAVIYNDAAGIVVTGETAAVASPGPLHETQDNLIDNMPEWLFTYADNLTVEPDTDHTLKAVMAQQVRALTLIIEGSGGSADRIESIEGTLSGAASRLHFGDGTHSDPASVGLDFRRIESGEHAGKWGASVRLLGIAGSVQKLHAVITFRDSSPLPLTLNSDLEQGLASFNNSKNTPLTLAGSIVETPEEVEFGATIESWEEVSGGNAIAD